MDLVDEAACCKGGEMEREWEPERDLDLAFRFCWGLGGGGASLFVMVSGASGRSTQLIKGQPCEPQHTICLQWLGL